MAITIVKPYTRQDQRTRIAVIAALAGACCSIAGTSLAGDPPTALQFSDQTAAAGLSFTHSTNILNSSHREWHMMTPGAAVADFNRDGWLDLFVNGGAGQNSALFINDGDGTFTDRAAEWGIDLTAAEGSSASIADVNGDGWVDLYVGTMDGRNFLFMNTGSGAFTENAIGAGVDLTVPQGGFDYQKNTFGGAFGDVDLDGDLDLYTSQWWYDTLFGNRLFLNDGSGNFTDVTQAYGLTQSAKDLYWAFTPIFQDMDGDAFPELIVASDFESSRYFANDGDGTFTRITNNGVATDENGMGATVGDYDGDGDPDWFVTSIYDEDWVVEPPSNWGITGNRLYCNEGNNQFIDRTGPGEDGPVPPDSPGVRYGYWGWGTTFADFDHDGDLDLTMTNGFQLPPGGFNNDPDFVTDPTRLWINDGDLNNPDGPGWSENAVFCGIEHNGDGKGLIAFDADNDGDLDLFITCNKSSVAYYRNDIDSLIPNYDQTWIEMELDAPAGVAPNGVGTKIELDVNGRTITQWVTTSGSFMCNIPSRQHFGFAPAATIDAVRIHWPTGQVTTMTDVPSGAMVLGAIGNIDGDDRVGVSDLGILIADFGETAQRSDLNNDGAVDTADLGLLIRNFGAALDGASKR